MTAVERQQTRFAVALSALFHVALLLWLALHPRALDGPLASEGVDDGFPVEFVLPFASLVGAFPEPEPPAQAPEPAPAPQTYVRTTENQQSPIAPESPDFISDRNTRAATAQAPAASGPDSHPTIREGLDEPGLSLEDRIFRDGPFLEESPSYPLTAAVQPARRPPPSGSSVQPGIDPLPPDPEAIPLLPPPGESAEQPPAPGEETAPSQTSATRSDDSSGGEDPPVPGDDRPAADTPPAPRVSRQPAPSTVQVPDRANDAYQPETAQRKMEGTLSNRGDPAFDAENTPVGQYMKKVTDAVGRKWHRHIRMNDALISFGTMRVQFRVNRFGTPSDIRVVRRTSNTAVEDITLRAILDADIPPMPPRVSEILDNGEIEITYNVLIY
ncbi:MAG TPA: hypothetical protein VMN36_09225 [Verrucomicrobiales bacterium]|nr:hypothetical protein [Verrucomicrobiales bacterium]